MSVYIKGVDIPEGYSAISIRLWRDGEVEVIDTEGEWSTTTAISVLDHGRLGDLDALTELVNAEIEAYMHGYKRSTWDFICELRDVVEKALTVIPADHADKESGE